MYRACRKCNNLKILEENFYKNKNVPSGYVFQCIECVKENTHKYYQKNKSIIFKKNKEYKSKNKDRYNEISRIWAKNNPQKRRLARKKWKAKNRHLVNHYEKARQARLSGAEGGHSYKEWEELLKKHQGKCFYCATTEKITKDHVIPVSKGGSDNITNIVPACVSCNSKKNNKHLSDHL